MKPHQEKALYRELRRERNKKFGKWLVLVAGVVLVLAIYTPVFSENVYGEFIGFSDNERMVADKQQIKVRLDTGKEIVVPADQRLARVVGQKVEISKMTSIAGMASFQFVRFVETNKE